MFSSFYCSQVDDYTHCTLKEDCWLRTTGHHHPGFPRQPLDTLIHIGYDGPIPDYYCRPYQKHGLPCCEVQVEIPINPEASLTGTVIRGDLDEAVERMAHLALTTMCEQHLPETASLAILLYLIRDQAEPDRQQHLKTICDVTQELFLPGWVQMAKYARYMFNLHLETTRIMAAYRTCVDISFAALQAHRIINVELHREYSPGIVFIFFQGRKDLYPV
jgi:hypothetical protein